MTREWRSGNLLSGLAVPTLWSVCSFWQVSDHVLKPFPYLDYTDLDVQNVWIFVSLFRNSKWKLQLKRKTRKTGHMFLLKSQIGKPQREMLQQVSCEQYYRNIPFYSFIACLNVMFNTYTARVIKFSHYHNFHTSWHDRSLRYWLCYIFAIHLGWSLDLISMNLHAYF